MHIHQHRCRALGVQHAHATVQHAFDCVLHCQVDRQHQRRGTIGRIAQIIVVLPFDARDADHLGGIHAFFAETGAAQHMGRQRAVRIQTHFARAKQQTGFANVMHGLFLFRRQFLLDPQELARAGKVFQQLVGLQVGEDRGQFMRGAFRVHHLGRLGIQSMGRQVGGQHPPVAIQNVGACHGDARTRGLGAGLGWLGGRQHGHATTDDQKGAQEHASQHQQTTFGPQPRLVTHVFVALTQVLAFDHIGVFTLFTRIQNAGQRTQRDTGHGRISPTTSTPPVISNSSRPG